MRKMLDDHDSRHHQHGENRHPARPGPVPTAPALAEDVIIHGVTATITLIGRHDDTRPTRRAIAAAERLTSATR